MAAGFLASPTHDALEMSGTPCERLYPLSAPANSRRNVPQFTLLC